MPAVLDVPLAFADLVPAAPWVTEPRADGAEP
jgi:hypothetical protein